MLHNLTRQALASLRLPGMAQAYDEQLSNPTIQAMAFDDRMSLLVDAEVAQRDQRRVSRLIKEAKLKQASACPEDIDFSPKRGIEKSQIQDLLKCEWIKRGQHVVITGLTGTGKTWLGCALSREATRRSFSVAYYRMPRLLAEMEVAHADGSLPKLRTRLAKVDVLFLDDWGVAPITACGRQNLLEMIDDRVPGKSVLITSQLPTRKWHDYLGEPTIADAILDRLLHNKHAVELKGDSLRRGATANTAV